MTFLRNLWRAQLTSLAAMRVAVTYGGWDFDFFELPDDSELLDDCSMASSGASAS